MTGVFISPGVTVSLPIGGLAFWMDESGEFQASASLHVHYDVCPIWLRLASRHLADAEDRKVERIAAWQTDDQDARARTLEQEFESSMQAVMAAAIALDALYQTLCDKIKLPDYLMEVWKKNGTSRHRRIAEVARRAFSLTQEGSAILRQDVKEIFRFRDMAVHPAGKTAAPVLHPELQVGVEWRLDAFRADNARLIVQQTNKRILELVTSGRPSTPELALYADSLRTILSRQS
jgi:hypothetical protein